MLIQIFCQFIGALVLLSLTITLFMYVRFKRHQKNNKSFFHSLSGYGSVAIIMIYLFSSYLKSAEVRFSEMKLTQQIETTVFELGHPLGQKIIDMRPLFFCDYESDSNWNPKCLLSPTEDTTLLKPQMNYLVDVLPNRLEIA